jgi:hypothetical protein
MEMDFSTELAKLMIFTGDTATAIRMYIRNKAAAMIAD